MEASRRIRGNVLHRILADVVVPEDLSSAVEAAILSPDRGEYRPDRVVVFPDGRVDIVDYKFGAPEPAYRRQVQRYVSLYRQMGHTPVRGFLWYFQDGAVEELKIYLYL